MSFKYCEGTGYTRQTFNPEEITDGRPRVVTFTRVTTKLEDDGVVEEMVELDRENPHLCQLEGLELEDKSLFLRMLADLQSETLVLLGELVLAECV
jgi:hypothetical protein